tara:strand:+ start:1838 stop:4330 length:2493 start_codon:yes stop_codon:yes gene_type:complete
MSLSKLLKTARQELHVSSMMPYTHLNSPMVFETKTGEIGSVLQVEGLPFVTEGPEALNQASRQLHQALLGLDESFMVYTTVHRSLASLALDGEFVSPFSKRVNDAYHARFKHQNLYRNTIYITVVLKGSTSGAAAKGMKGMARLRNHLGSDHRSTQRSELMNQLSTKVQQLESMLAPFKPHCLGSRDKSLGYSELMQFLSLIPNGGDVTHPAMPAFTAPIATSIPDAWTDEFLYPEGNLSQYLCSKRLFFGDFIQFQGVASDDTRFGVMLSIKKYGQATGSVCLDPLLTLDCEFITTHSFAFESRDAALKAIAKKRGKLINAEDLAYSQITDLSALENNVAGESSCLGFHHNTVLLLADSQEKLELAMRETVKAYSYSNTTLTRESLGSELAFWAQLPANPHFITRAALITSENFVDFCSLHNYKTGFYDENHLGQALTLLESESRTPVYFNYHGKSSKTNPAPGHTAIYGATNSGKNVLVSFMDAQMERYGQRSFFIDRDEASKIYVLSSPKSAYTVISPEHQDAVRMNPFQLTDTHENRGFVKGWLKELVKKPGEVDLPSSISDALNECVDYAFGSLDKPYRKLSHVAQCLPRSFERWSELNPWLHTGSQGTEGEYAWLFDNDEDALEFDFDKVGFDVTWLMKPEMSVLVSTPVYAYILHRMEQSMDGSRLTSFVIDEAWQVFKSPYWLQILEDWLPSIRKKNGHFVFMTQTPESVLGAPISPVILNSLATSLYFPNPDASSETYEQGLKLTPSEYETVKHLNPASRLMLYKQKSEGSMVCRLDLSDLTDELRVFSGNTQSVKLFDDICHEQGGSPHTSIDLFLERSR